MTNYNPDRKYESLKIPSREQFSKAVSGQSMPRVKAEASVSLGENLFYEIEYDSCPMPGVGKFVLKSQKIEQPPRDEIRELFQQMREIARQNRSYSYSSSGSGFYDKKMKKENSRIFYKQGMFMKDFTDQYAEAVPYSSYFPYYQMMGYEQLRTYFTWRTQVREGNVTDTSLSYAFLYLYELLSNIGVEDAQDGLHKLMAFWQAFRVYNGGIDKYVLRWLKDYHIYYELPHTFHEFMEENNLGGYYPELSASNDQFALFCGISKYDIRKSAFYAADKVQLIRDCFEYTINKVRQIYEEKGIPFEETIFRPTKNTAVWTPFKDALFYPWKRQSERRVVLSEKEIYICGRDGWMFSTVVTTEGGKKLIGYVMKQMESVLRKLTNYRHKLSADISTVTHVSVVQLREMGVSLERVVTEAVTEFYREATKTVVKVDPGALAKIRQEALMTQEKLIVPEDEMGVADMPVVSGSELYEIPPVLQAEEMASRALQAKEMASQALQAEGMASQVVQANEMSALQLQLDLDGLSPSDCWQELKETLNTTEINALALIVRGESNMKQYADERGVMLEVLIDGINEKAMDIVGDSLLDEEFMIYEDYEQQIEQMLRNM